MPSERNPGLRIVERVDLKATESMMRNYKDPLLAVADLIDNAVDDRVPGVTSRISINTVGNQITIINVGGHGLDLDGLQKFFTWKPSEKEEWQIGQYGVGGKSAMGFLGKSIEVRCSAAGSNIGYILRDPNWREKPSGYEREHDIDTATAPTDEGYVQIKISDLDRKPNAHQLMRMLGDTYRPLLRDGSIVIKVNNRPVEPLEIKYLESEPGLMPERIRVETGYGLIFVEVGILEEGQSTIKPGIRGYYRGRLIEDGLWFDFPSPATGFAQASRLIGEVDLPFIGVTTNKSNFIKGDVRWEEAAYRITNAMKTRGWEEKLKQVRVEKRHKIEQYEFDLAKDAKRLHEHIEHIISQQTGQVYVNVPGSSGGRLPPAPSDEPRQSPVSTHKYTPTQGQTYPDKLAVQGKETIKRRGIWDDYEPVSMGNPNVRSEIVEIGGRKVLRINTEYPLYQAAKVHGHAVVQMYQLETAVLEAAKRECAGQSAEDLLKWLDPRLKFMGELFSEQTTPKGISPRGSIRFNQGRR